MREPGRAEASTDAPSTTRVEVSHAAVRARLGEWLEDALPGRQRAAVGAHLARCEGCRAFGRTLAETTRQARRLPRARLPDGVRGRLLALGRDLTEAEERSGGSNA